MNAKMYEEEIVRAVMEVLKELSPANTGDAPGVEFGASVVSDGEVPDVTATPEQELCLIENCARSEELLEMKKRTPARTLTGRVGVRENTLTVLRKRANLAAMVDAVWEPLNREMAESFHFPILKSIPNSKEEYLMRPDLGRQLDQESLKVVRTKVKKSPDVQIVIGEGQSNSALERSMPELLPALLQGLEVNHINYGTPVFVEYTRVGIGDQIAKEVGAKAVCVVLGERPGLLTWRSLGCYITYQPEIDIQENKRTVVSNILDDGGTPPAEAGAYIADLIQRILQEKKSGVELIL